MRDTIRIRLGAGHFGMRPTFGALAEIEGVLRSSLSEVYAAHYRMGLTALELGEIVRIGLEANGEATTGADACAERLYELGVYSDEVRRPIGAYLLALGWAPEEARKKLAAEWGDDAAAGTPTAA